MAVAPLSLNKPSLRVAIFTVLFAVVTVLTLVHGTLGYVENKLTVNEFSSALLEEKQRTITTVLTNKFTTQSNLDHLAATTISSLYLTGGIPAIERYLLDNVKLFPQISAVFFSTQDNVFCGYIRQQDFLHMYSNPTTNFAIQFVKMDSNGNENEVVNRRDGFYATQRPWYKSALADETKGFSAVFTYHAYATLALPHSLPVYKANGEILGVVGSNIFLGEFGGYLQEQMRPFSGEAVILDEQNRLIASSLDVSTIIAEESRSRMLNAGQSDNPFVQLAFQHMSQPSPASENLPEFAVNGEMYRSAAFQFDAVDNLNWKVVMFVPEQAYHTTVNQLLWKIGALMLLSLTLAGLMALWLSRTLSNPISNLITRFSHFENKPFQLDNKHSPTIELQEVSELKAAIANYHQKFDLNFNSLIKQVAENQRQLAQIRQLAMVSQSIDDMSMIISREGQMLWVNKPFLDFFDMAETDVVKHELASVPVGNTAKQKLIEELSRRIQNVEHEELPENFAESVDDTQHFEFRFFAMKEEVEGKILVIVRDITEQKAHEEELAIWQRIFESTRVGIAISLKNNQYVDIVNPAFAEMYGGSIEGYVGCDISTFYPEDAQSTPDDLRKQVQEKGGITVESEHVRSNGERFPVLLSITLVHNNEGKVLGRVTMLTDLSEPKQLQQQLFQSQKIHAIGSLAGGIVHDMNNVLGAIQSNAELGLLNTQLARSNTESKSHSVFSSILAAAQRGSKLTQQVMSFSRMETIHTTPVSINRLLTETVDLFSATITSDTQVSMQSTLLDDHAIQGNESQLHQVFMNLLNNGFKAIKKAQRDHGSIEIMATIERDNRVHVSVTDNGCGIPKQAQPFIFDPFFTTEAKGKGTGLGLAIVERIMTSHNGEIKLTSEEGKGTRFDLWFDEPFVFENEEKSTLTVESFGQEDKHIVVVDDDNAILNVWTELLQFKEYRVTPFLDSTKALAFCIENASEIDCIFTDFDMPNLNGERFCEAIRKHDVNVKIIMATGYSEALSETKCEELNIAKLMYKPIAFDAFLAEVETVLS